MQPITTAMMVRASQASLGSSGVCVSERLSKDAKLAAPLAQSLFSRPRGRGPARGRRRHTMAVEALVPPDAARVATVYTIDPKRLREAVLVDLCTLFCPHGRSCDRVGPRVPQRRRPHGPRDAKALGPEAHAAGAAAHLRCQALLSPLVALECHRHGIRRMPEQGQFGWASRLARFNAWGL